MIAEYTREAGVRSLEREIATLCRKAATLVATGHKEKLKVDEERVREWLGPRHYSGDVRKRTSDPGVATGLAYTTVGGDVLFIEATAYPGKGELDHHRAARRGDAGVRAGGALLGALAHQELGLTRSGSPSTTSTSTCPPERCPRTAPRPA